MAIVLDYGRPESRRARLRKAFAPLREPLWNLALYGVLIASIIGVAALLCEVALQLTPPPELPKQPAQTASRSEPFVPGPPRRLPHQ